MNIHNPELHRQASNYLEVRKRLWFTKPAPKPPKPREPVYVRYMVPQIPLWSRKDIKFDAHVRAWQWELCQREDPTVYIKRRSESLKIPFAVMVGFSLRRDITPRRQLLMWEILQKFGFSMPQTAKLFGGRDHTTVLHAFRKIDAMTEEDRKAIDTPVISKVRVR